MRRIITFLLSACVAGAAMAQDSALQRLDVGDEARQWEAVGRLELGGRGFCTGALVAPDLVLTAAHCLFDKETGARIDPAGIEFMAGWRNGRAAAYRTVRRAVTHPDYAPATDVTAQRVRNDVALNCTIRSTTPASPRSRPTSARAKARRSALSAMPATDPRRHRCKTSARFWRVRTAF
jgi:V8-like Glu-specific endopeptidase